MGRPRSKVRIKMRRDAPYLERKHPVSTAVPGSLVIEMDKLAEEQGVDRSAFVLRAIEAQLARHRAAKAA